MYILKTSEVPLKLVLLCLEKQKVKLMKQSVTFLLKSVFWLVLIIFN